MPDGAPTFAVAGYTTFEPQTAPGRKKRILILVRSSVATRSNARLASELMDPSVPSVWIRLDAGLTVARGGGRTAVHGAILLGGLYRQWSHGQDRSMEMEREQLETFTDQVSRAAAGNTSSIVLIGDVNLNSHRADDPTYTRRGLLSDLWRSTNAAGLRYLPSAPTFRSYGCFASAGTATREHRISCLDHAYVSVNNASVEVLADATTDHRPLLLRLGAGGLTDQGTATLKRRNFKQIERAALERALEKHDWTSVHKIRDVDEVYEYIVAGVVAALDEVAPLRTIRVKRGRPLYLQADTLEVMRDRDVAKGARYRSLRNRASAMVGRDRRNHNAGRLAAASGDPRVLWDLANEALGKDRPTLPTAINVLDGRGIPDGSRTVGDRHAADVMNAYYVSKITLLRERNVGCEPAAQTAWPKEKRPFAFSFASAGKIAKTVKGLNPTEALGHDGIPVSVWKKGIDVLAAPVAHLVNASLASGVVPAAFKKGIVHPVYKGNGKNRSDPASYRPVSVLVALSKVLEVIVKSDLERHLRVVNGLPESQHGFRAGRSCATALASAHSCWVMGTSAGKVVGVAAFDLTAAFDTLDPGVLLPKLELLGLRSTALSWFTSYLTGGTQSVCWKGSLSGSVAVGYGVRQGSILGPVLFLVHVADMPDAVGFADAAEGGCSSYADDSIVWVIGDSAAEVIGILNAKAAAFARHAKANGLAMNAGKTQFTISSEAGITGGAELLIDGRKVAAGATFELLGVTFDKRFSTRPHDVAVAHAARQRASLIARLAHHIPQGNYLTQLARGLVVGKVAHALPAISTPRFEPTDARNLQSAAVQVAFNDVSRSVTGARRSDRITVGTLLGRANMPSFNRLTIEAIALETWKAFHSTDGLNGRRNPTGQAIFGSDIDVTRPTRASAAGEIRSSTRGTNIMVTHAAMIWNKSPALRLSTTAAEAKAAGKALALGCPL